MATPIPQNERCSEGSDYQIDGVQILDTDDRPALPKEDVTWSMCDQSGNQVATGKVSPALEMSLDFTGEQTTISDYELEYAKLNRQFRTINQTKVYWVTRRVYVRGITDTTIRNDTEATGEFIFYIDNILCLKPSA